MVSFLGSFNRSVVYDHRPSPDASLPVCMTLDVHGPSVAVKVPPGWYSLADGSSLEDTLIFTAL